MALVRRFQSERIWLGLVTSGESIPRVGPQEGFDQAVEVARLGSGETEVVVHADPSVVGEMRAVAISIFYAIGTGAGGFVAPALLGALIGTGSRESVFLGYALAGALMLLGALAEAVLGVDAERKPLEAVARPLSCDQ